MNSEHKGRSPFQPVEPRIERTAFGDPRLAVIKKKVEIGDPRLAVIKKRVERGYYDSDAVIQEIVEAMMESMDRRASK